MVSVLPSSVVMTKGRLLASMWAMFSWRARVPKRSACSLNLAIISGPLMPWGKPGKFSTSLVHMSWPPGTLGAAPSKTTGERLARAV